MSILALNGEGGSTLIIPEAALNAGWLNIAFKIERFINSSSHLDKTDPPRLTEASYPYAKAVQDSNWQTKKL